MSVRRGWSLHRWARGADWTRAGGGAVKKDDREIMNILEAFDLTGCAHSAARLTGCDPKTVRRWVRARDRGLPVGGPGRRERLIDPFLDKVEEWVDRSKGQVRADVVHERLVAVGFAGDERTTRRAVAEAKTRWRAGHRRTYRPWITEPGMWCQFDWGVGPAVPFAGGPARATLLFCLWLAGLPKIMSTRESESGG